jgi:hypothetical protein
MTYARHVRSERSLDEDREIERVDLLADQLRAFLHAHREEIRAAHVHSAPSGAIQALVSSILTQQLSFEEEVVIHPEDGLVTRARPDFFFDLGDDRGILAEVERGGTTTNNHDLKDLWKAHVSPNTQHLFLVVPESNWRADGSAREKPFPIVARRLGAFFGNPRREIDVLSLHIFGY